VVCRPAIGPCDVEEVCDGSAATCPDGGPSQDIDGDGVCNANDPCTNVAGEQNFVTPPISKVRLGRINADIIPGNDRVRLTGMFRLPPGQSFANLQPDLRGARLVLQANGGETRVDVTLSAGTYAGIGTRGWEGAASGRRWTYRDKTTAPNQGIVKMVIVDKDAPATPGLVKVVIVGRNGTYPVIEGDQPIKATVGLGDQADAIAGLCGETYYTAALDCLYNRPRSALACRR
jgi:hypothetical protein